MLVSTRNMKKLLQLTVGSAVLLMMYDTASSALTLLATILTELLPIGLTSLYHQWQSSGVVGVMNLAFAEQFATDSFFISLHATWHRECSPDE